MDDYFLKPSTRAQKQYEALRTCFIDGLSTKEVAAKFGCTYRAVTSLVADFRKAPWKSGMKKTHYNKVNAAKTKSIATD